MLSGICPSCFKNVVLSYLIVKNSIFVSILHARKRIRVEFLFKISTVQDKLLLIYTTAVRFNPVRYVDNNITKNLP